MHIAPNLWNRCAIYEFPLLLQSTCWSPAKFLKKKTFPSLRFLCVYALCTLGISNEYVYFVRDTSSVYEAKKNLRIWCTHVPPIWWRKWSFYPTWVLHDSISVFSFLRMSHIIYILQHCTDLGCFRYLRNPYKESTDILLCRQGRVKAVHKPTGATQHRRNVLCRPYILSFSEKKENMLSCYYEPTRLRDAFTFYIYQASNTVSAWLGCKDSGIENTY